MRNNHVGPNNHQLGPNNAYSLDFLLLFPQKLKEFDTCQTQNIRFFDNGII